MALRLLGRDVTFYRFPGEGHELSRSGSPLHRVQRAEIILDFFSAEARRRRPERSGLGRATRRSACARSRCAAGSSGRSSRRYHCASTISVGSQTISPGCHSARKPIIRLCGNGHGWLPR